MVLSVENINKSFKDKNVLNDISFRVEGGSAMGLLGRNGAGKTTTIRIITDIFRADGGKVLLDGQEIDYSKTKIGYLPEERGLYPKIKVGEQMVYIGTLKGMDSKAAKKSAHNILEELGAAEYWDKKLETLSKGNQQKIQLAVSILHDPDVVILDEPFSGLDPVNAQALKDMIMKQMALGKVILFSSHQMPYVEDFCRHICILRDGRISADGNIKDIKKSYPRNRIAVVPEGPTREFLGGIAGDAEIKTITTETADRGEYIEFVLKSPDDKNNLFALFGERKLGIDSFSVIEPTLEDIFV
jgi:ABC-2 type transport system ATP-binding protein